MKIQDESQSIFFLGDQMSSLPIFWEAEVGNKKIKQVDKTGDVINKWQEINSEELFYWGMVTSYGNYGFYPQSGQMRLNNFCVKLGDRKETSDGTNIELDTLKGNISYRRRVIADSDGAQQTMMTEITFGKHCLAVRLVPNFEVIYSQIKGDVTSLT